MQELKTVTASITGAKAAYLATSALVDAYIGFPITPSTEMMEQYASHVAEGRLPRLRFMAMDAENSALAALIGASICGARVTTATCSQGLMLGVQQAIDAAGKRAPIVSFYTTRGNANPITLGPSHEDVLTLNQSGTIFTFCGSHQELYDRLIQAFKVAEYCAKNEDDSDVMLPHGVCIEGFLGTHVMDTVTYVSEESRQALRDFVGKYRHPMSLLGDVPTLHGAYVHPPFYMGIKRKQLSGMERALEVIPEVWREFGKTFWKDRGHVVDGLVETYELEDAERVIVLMGTPFGTVKGTVEMLRERGIKAGALRVISYRPFPDALVHRYLKNARTVAVLNRTDSPGAPLPAFSTDVVSALKLQGDVSARFIHRIYALGGGSELDSSMAEEIYEYLGVPEQWVGEDRAKYLRVAGGHDAPRRAA